MLLLATFSTLLLALPLALLAPPAATGAVAAAAFVSGVGLEVFAVCWDTTMQQQISEHMLSRLYAYDALGSICLVPVGLALIGPVADAIRNGGDALRRRCAGDRRDTARVRGPRRQGAAKEVPRGCESPPGAMQKSPANEGLFCQWERDFSQGHASIGVSSTT
jgi:hypothetical protein